MGKYEGEQIKKLMQRAERVGTLGSPSSTGTLSVEILETAVSKKLVGEMILFNFIQDSKEHFGLGQINEVILKNKWLEDPTMRALARRRGNVNQVSGMQDTHRADVMVSAVFGLGEKGFEPSVLGTVPPTGTMLHLVNDEILDLLLNRYKNEIFYLGRIYGSETKLPMWFKHFGTGPAGAGEAYHIGVFGRTGSGKSVLAKMITLAYARHADMGIFILDPQGEFALGLGDGAPGIKSMGNVLCKPVLRKLGREAVVYDIENILLQDWYLFTHFLKEFGFFSDLGIKYEDYQEIAADYLEDFLRDSGTVSFQNLSEETLLDVLNYLYRVAEKIYAGKAGYDRVRSNVDELKQKMEEGTFSRTQRTWNTVIRFFKWSSGKKTPAQIINDHVLTTEKKPVVVIDLSKKAEGVSEISWNESIKPLIIGTFLGALVREAENHYKEGKSLNTLVVIDEAHRFVPSGRLENRNSESVRRTLIDAVRTTRKYGLGWMFISQTLSSLDREIVEQLRISFFGFGLSMGSELRSLTEIIGGSQSAMNLYQSFRDPHSSFDLESRQYSFMTVGPVSPLSFAGTPLFFNAFNDVGEFLRANNLEIY